MSKMRNRGKGLSAEWVRRLNQEDLLAEIAERLQIEMSAENMRPESLAKVLNQSPSYVDGVLEGFSNITVRELADIFSAFGKIVALNLINQSHKREVVEKVFNEPSVFKRVEISVTKKDNTVYIAKCHFVSDKLPSSEGQVLIEEGQDFSGLMSLGFSKIKTSKNKEQEWA